MSNEYEPVLVKVGDDEIEFRRLDVDDLERWAGQVKAKAILDERTRVMGEPTLKSNVEAQQTLIQRVSQQDVTFFDLWRRSFTPSGARKVLAESLKKAGKTDGEAVAIIRRIHWARHEALAKEIMSPAPQAVLEDEQSRPPAEMGTNPDDATDSSNAQSSDPSAE